MTATMRASVRTLCMAASSKSLTKSLTGPYSAVRQGGSFNFSQPFRTVRCFSSSSLRRASAATVQSSSYDLESRSAKRTSTLAEAEETRFDTLRGIVSDYTLKAITAKPFNLTTMTPVQAAVLPLLPGLAEPYRKQTAEEAGSPIRDLLVRAKTGTGKTLAFLVPAIEARLKAIDAYGKMAVKDAGLTSDRQLEKRAQNTYARNRVGTLIISPTRELATQIANEALRLSSHHDGFEVRLIVGGVSKRMQLREWSLGRRDIVVATPGRMWDLLQTERDIVDGIKFTQTLILDEADTLLDMGFRDDIEAIVNFLPKAPERQTFLFSATVSRAIQQVARATLDPKHKFINTVDENTSPVHAHVQQYHTVLPSASEQIPHVLRLLAHDQLSNPGSSKVIVFLPTTKMTQLYATFIRELAKGVLPSGRQTKVYEIHSKRAQDARASTSNAFRKDQSGACVLVTSDVSARGVDYPGVSRVIQVGIPGSTDQYVHRVGRTGRAGTQGRGDLVLLPWEVGFVTWQLQEMPLKPVTTNDLKKQVTQLAENFDANPSASLKHVKTHLDKFGRPQGPVIFKTPVTPALNEMGKEIERLLAAINEQAIHETFSSLLGYYVGKTGELRVQKGVVIDGCKDWAVEACGLPNPPYVSDIFLQRLGAPDGRKRSSSIASRQDRSRPSWDSREPQRPIGRARESPGWMQRKDGPDANDRAGNSAGFRGYELGRGGYAAFEPRQSNFEADRNVGGYKGGGRSGGRPFGRSGAGESGYGMRR